MPREFRVSAFNAVHSVNHPGTRTTRKMMQHRYIIWHGMNKDVTQWTKECINCQKSKILRHTVSPHGHFIFSDRFGHLHVDIVGPLIYCEGFRYIVTMVDRKTGWPEAYPVNDISAETVADIMYSGWISRFGCPIHITTDQESTFLSQLFTHLTRRMGINKFRTTAYHPQANGLVERWHRSLKAALMCRGRTKHWVSELPTVLMGVRASLRMISIPTKEQRPGKNFVQPELKTCTHVFYVLIRSLNLLLNHI
ncbi:unnamed protein product [Pieris macdunnoughi]|uniref:RNA-directed DNA polymerase n=1 Tax=Pieris macdunnoughi TaxID=345717 RepID=A0A821UAX2_9NEOP|nr:unnamed protein product [Pieris macdunnoughi]